MKVSALCSSKGEPRMNRFRNGVDSYITAIRCRCLSKDFLYPTLYPSLPAFLCLAMLIYSSESHLCYFSLHLVQYGVHGGLVVSALDSQSRG